MRLRTWSVVAVASAALLLLLVVSLSDTRRKAQHIYSQLDALNVRHRYVEAKLRRLRSDVNLSGIFIRDYLLDHHTRRAPQYRAELQDLRQSTTATIGTLTPLVGEPERRRLQSLRTRLDDYWQTFDPLFDWTPAQKAARSGRFLRQEVLPRRNAVLAIAGEVERINNANLEDQRAEVAQRERELRQYLDGLLWRSLALGLFAALAAVIRILILERRSERQRERTERAEGELRRLSHQLVRAQEDERRRLSRELHDEIGQTLTALRIELHRAERAPALSAPTFVAAVAECRRLIDQVTHAARDLAMGLRPNMLDDLGLEPALSWHTQDFSRRYKVPVDLSVSGDLQELPEPHRTCLYRVVQEALTNCARHARATRVSVIVERKGDRISLSVLDDGVGMDLRRQHEGLGLIGIEERLRELGGTMAIRSAPGEGTVLVMWLPVPAGQREAAGAHSGC